jgi:neutral ceramidase
MLGYGQTHNIVKERGTPLYARALAFCDIDENYFIFINVELAFATIALKEAITQRLSTEKPECKFSLANIMLTSQHTHSAPGGYSHYPFYNFTIPGFRPDLFNNIVEACVEAVKEAVDARTPSVVSWGSYDIPLEKNVAFNRSMKAFRRNPEFKNLEMNEASQAINRTMQGLNIFDLQGNLKAHLNWFGVHATSISSFNTKLHHDNKGVAASLMEQRNQIFAIFAQEAAGDVSPNYVWDKKINRMRGTSTDQYENAATNGDIQATSADLIKNEKSVEGYINCVHGYFDLSVNAGHAAHGLGFFLGTLEGPGLTQAAAPAFRLVAVAAKRIRLFINKKQNDDFFAAQGNKDVLLDHRQGNLFGIPLSFWKKLPLGTNSITGELFTQLKSGAIDTTPWVPEILPFQIIQLGNIFIVGVPGEITTIAAQRLKIALAQILNSSQIIISSYANAYMGYVTTPEEYDEQCYEGGHCLYGRNTLPAFIENFSLIAKALSKNLIYKNDLRAFQFPPEELQKRSF